MIQEAIILAGGLGTRLRSVVADVPKCMAPVAGRPFIFYVINQLRSQGIEKFIFSLGYKHELVVEYLSRHFSTLDYQVTIEDEPLGTGGAARQACFQAGTGDVLLVNGDTLFKVNIAELAAYHKSNNAACTLSLKPMEKFDRYGLVELNQDGTIRNFKEKRYYERGLINGGVYALNRAMFLQHGFPLKFSFEKDYLETNFSKEKMYGFLQDEYFVDIGIPEDYAGAQATFSRPPLDLKKIDPSWTLFLDRDGVINVDKNGSYVFNPEEFIFYDGVPEAFRLLAAKFGRIIIITNQKGVGRGLMNEHDLAAIHAKMTGALEAVGVSIAGIYYCTSINNKHPDRKPNPGMAIRAKKKFPEIDFTKTIMVGNNLSDMAFGRNTGAYTAFIKTTRPTQEYPHPDIDLIFNSLPEFAKAL